MNQSMKESHLRSLVKGISWRIAGTMDTIFVSYLITGKATYAFSIGAVELITKIFLYYLHERAWAQVKWGWVPAEERPKKSA
ncbi:MAG: hypothetical protein KatS3mg033_1523 [Thermonema sp.]|nr:MAG: hypothetical protein KatS3mg033_1523 [Thermonema sp.]